MLPSDIARLVLVYLKDEGLTQSYKQFFNESPHLEELRQHPNVEPSVPYERGLPEMLNEYAKLINAIKERMNCNQLVNSLWNMHNEVIGQLKFQYTGNAGLLNTPSPEQRSMNQGARTRYRLTGLRKQQELQRKLAAQHSMTTPIMTTPISSPSSLNPTPHSTTNSSYSAINSTDPAINSTQSVISSSHPLVSSQSTVNSVSVATSPINIENVMSNLTRVCDAGPVSLTRAVSPGMEVEVPADNNTEVVKSSELQNLHETVNIPEFRTPVKNPNGAGTQLETPTGKSPKRKSAAPRRMQAAIATSISPRSDTTSVYQWEEEMKDLPEVLESLINNIEFQEKLAWNINKARPVETLDKDNEAEPARVASSAHNLSIQSSTTIEELLNIQMSEDTIHDIVQKTSSDPAFESLFSLFSSNSQDGTSQQFNETDLANENHPSSSDIITDQSQCPSDQGDGQVVHSSANRNDREIVSAAESAASSNTDPASTVGMTIGANLDQVNDTDTRAAVTMTTAQSPLQLVTTSSLAPDIMSNQPMDQAMSVPLILNQSGQYQLLQQPNSPGVMMNLPDGLSGGTIFMSPDGRIIGTSGLVLQTGQLLQPNGHLQSVSLRQAGTQEGLLNGGTIQNAAPNDPDVCPVHGRKVDHSRIGEVGTQQTAGASTSEALKPVTPSVVTQKNSTQNPGASGQSDVVQLFETMVESDVGSLFNCPPENTHPSSPPSPKCPLQGVGSRKRGTRSSITPHHQGSRTANNNNRNNNHSEMPQSRQLGLGTRSAENLATTQPSQMNESRNVFSAISNEVLKPVPGTRTLVPLGMSTSSETSIATSPPVKAVKQRKQIQFKEPILLRPLDFGEPVEAEHIPRGRPPANSSQQPKLLAKTQTRGKHTEAKNVVHRISSSDTVSGQKPATITTSKPANRLATPTKSTSEKVPHASGDMSAEVNIAAQMLVCLSNSPPSLRQSPYRLQRLRTNSGCSPEKSPTRDRIVELRKEIGLTPKNNRLQQNAETDTHSKTTKASLEMTRGKNLSSTNTPNNQGKTQAMTPQIQNDTNSSKRKSRTPRKQTHTVTETVVLAVPSEPHQKSKTSSHSTVKTRATLQKSKSPGKVAGDSVATRKSSRNSKSPGRPTSAGQEKGELGGGVGDNSEEDVGKKQTRGQKRSRESISKEEKTKKPKTVKNPKKSTQSQGFPSNFDVDKFLSSLQYAE